MPVTLIKEDAKKLVEQLSDGATWDDLIREIRVRRSIEAGLDDVRDGRVVPLKDVRKEFGLK